MTVADVAKKYGITRGRVHQLMASRGVAGQRVGNLIVLTPREVDRLKPGPVGRPKKGRD
jgi:hypothetical protein